MCSRGDSQRDTYLEQRTLSVETAVQRLTDLLEAKGDVTTEDLESDVGLTSEDAEDLNAAACLIEMSGEAFVWRETGGPPGVGFTGMKRKARRL
jgi:hypothetical protein